MNILEKKFPQQDIIWAMKKLQFGDNELGLVGTSSLKSQLYAADYDFMTKIPTIPSNVYDIFKEIIDSMNGDLYFIEFKFQNKDGSKFKIFKDYDFTRDMWSENFDKDNIQYCKIDGIVFIEGVCKEISVIYFFGKGGISNEDYIKALLADNVTYYNEGKYYKSLKRIMVPCKLVEPQRLGAVVNISGLFNSQVGLLYQVKNQIDALIIFLEHYKGAEANKRAQIFLINLGLKGVSVKDLPNLSADYGKLIDREGLRFYKHYNLKPGKIPAVNSAINNYIK
jgi:hypothetical protein